MYLNDTDKTTTCRNATASDKSTIFIPYQDDTVFWGGTLDCFGTTTTALGVKLPDVPDAISDIQYAGIETLHFFRTYLGLDGGIHEDGLTPITVGAYAHYGTNYCNAFYYGGDHNVYFGDWNCKDLTLLTTRLALQQHAGWTQRRFPI